MKAITRDSHTLRENRHRERNKNENTSSKKGELTTQQMVMLIIVIASFAILLFFLFRLNIGEESNKELCRNSVVLSGRSGLPTGSLSCYRSYKCITNDGDCKGLTDPEIIKVKTENETYEALAKEMTDCWWMFGEGRINYVGTDFTHNNYCSICSQILLDPSLSKIDGIENSVSKDKLYDYLVKTKIPGKEITYSEYLLNTKNIASLKQASFEQTGVDSFGNLRVGEINWVVMGITSQVGTIGWVIAAGVGTAVGIFLATPVGWVTAGIVVAAVSIGGAAAGMGAAEEIEPHIGALIVDGKGVKNKFMSPTIIEVRWDEYKALNCEDTVTLP